MSNINQFDHVHIDVLREIGSIGAGNAASALAKMIGKTVRMRVPMVKFEEFKNIADFVGGGESLIAGVLVGLSGEVNGIMMFILQTESAHTLSDFLLNQQTDNLSEFSEMELSALQEVGNILCSSYLSSLSYLAKIRIVQSVPYLAVDMANAILSVPAIEFGKHSDNVLLIESVFEANENNIAGYFLLVPDLPSFKLILSSLLGA